ncbi:hypothetical protein VNO78_26014 [Psophocarpus tetragonolobus]|uniref:Uncharacterized protein n=1 Tax=Psophocarpus tetragonolobus TaxID=3891 RepID=A0AAN9XFG2_PSOTE
MAGSNNSSPANEAVLDDKMFRRWISPIETMLGSQEIDHRTAFKKLQQLLGNGVKVEDVLSDLKLVENQIPLFIIDKLYQIVLLSENNPTSVKQATETLINSCALSLCGCSLGSNNVHKLERAHFLELTHSFLTRKENGDKEENATNPAQEINKEVSVPIDEHRVTSMVIWVGKKDADGNGNQTSKRETKSKLKSCTARLQAAGIKIEAFPLPFNCTSSVEEKFIDDIGEGIQVEASADARFSAMINDLNNICYKRNQLNDGAEGNSCKIMTWHHYTIGFTHARETFRYLRETLNHDYTSTPWKTLGVVAGVVLLGLTIAQTVLAAISL